MIPRCFIILFLLKLIYFFTLGQSQNTEFYKGCYKERSGTARLLPEVFTQHKTTLTPELCIRECRTKGFTYAGVQNGDECFCSNTSPSYKYSAEEEECSTPCVGDKTQKCGAPNRMNIYETHDAVRNSVESNYLGCSDLSSKRQLVEKSEFFPNRLTPELCVGYCYRRGQRFAGLLNSECMCGNNDVNILKKTFVDDIECDKKCENNKFICGGYLRSSIYSTGIPDYSEDENLLGCYEDGPVRLLTGFYMRFPDNNSPKLCYNICVGNGFKYAGVQIGVECFCGNVKPKAVFRRAELDCSIPCPGERTSGCGGVWRMNIYSSEEKGVGEPIGYMGCYEDGPKRILSSSRNINMKNNSVTACIDFCLKAGFHYAGVQVGVECLCGNDKLDNSLIKAESDCSLPCSGAPDNTCGGHWRMKIYYTNSSWTGYYKGCYRERSGAARFFPEFYKIFRSSLTPDVCNLECRNAGFIYAAVQFGHECFCSNTWPSYKYSADEEDCSTPCEGDRNQKCGGSDRMNIYETDLLELNNNVDYIGCLDLNNKKLLQEKTKLFPDNLITPELCIGYCFRNGYRFAAVKSSECRCGDADINVIKENLVNKGECNIKCGNGILICGGHSKSSVYSTGIAGDSEDEGLLGCFEDSPSTVLTGYSINYPQNNSPKLCFNLCKGSGYKYAGVKNKIECLCGNVKPDKSRQKPKEDCNTPCPGEPNKICGGDRRVVIYTTNGQSEPDGYLGCYQDGNQRILPEFRLESKTENSPKFCINHCRSANYAYAGVQVGVECFCGKRRPDDNLMRSEIDCAVACPGAPTKGCGGIWRMNIYNTE